MFANLGGWGWEIAAMLSSIACLCAMAVLLAIFDDRLVFSSHGVTLNAVVALLSTLSKTTLLFVLGSTIGQWKWILYSRGPRPLIDAYIIDEASRGPLGSLWMIWRMRESFFTTLGAICTVLSLAVDPFSQQLIQQRDLEVSGTVLQALMPRAQRFSKGLGDIRRYAGDNWLLNLTDPQNTSEQAYNNSRIFTAADTSIQSAILSGLTQSKQRIVQQLPFTCETGNCSFPPIQSLAVCNQCVNVTDQLEASFDDVPMAPTLVEGGDAIFRTNGTRFTLPNGLYISNPEPGTNMAKAGSVVMVSYGTGNSTNTVSFQDVDAMIWSMTMIRAQNDSANEFNWPEVPIQATECSLSYCVREFSSKVTNGRLNESVITNETARRSWDSWQPDSNVYTSFKWSGNVSVSLEYNINWSFIPRTDLVIGDGFQVSQEAVDSISNYFQTTMTDPSPPGSPYATILNGFYVGFPGQAQYLQFQPQAMQAFASSTNLTETFENIAISMTNAIRAGADGGAAQQGQNNHFETRFKIQWPWFALHILLSMVGICDLLIVITVSASQAIPPWKSHLLAVMAWGGHLDNPTTRPMTTNELERIARMKSAVLHHSTPVEEVPLQESLSKIVSQTSNNQLDDEVAPAYSSPGVYRSGYSRIS